MTRTIGTDMAEHLAECPILKPCCDDDEFPEHGFCGNFVARCLHCMAECICDALRACEDRVSRAFHEAGYAAGYGAAMDDGWGEPGHIKEAVAAALAVEMTGQDVHEIWMDALAAIKALKEGKQ